MKAKMVFKALNSMLPCYLSEKFPRFSTLHSRNANELILSSDSNYIIKIRPNNVKGSLNQSPSEPVHVHSAQHSNNLTSSERPNIVLLFPLIGTKCSSREQLFFIL